MACITNVGTGNKCTVNGTACSGARFSLTGGWWQANGRSLRSTSQLRAALALRLAMPVARPITIDLVACCQGISNQLTDWFISPAPVPAPLAGAGLPGLLAGFSAILGWYRKRRAATA